MRIRLNKLLATRGVAARRKCDALIQSGVVQVNGETITAPGAHVDPDHDDVRVNGRRVPGAATLRYYVLNKPVGMISTLSDPQGRRSLREVLPPGTRVFPVGRLDADTSGLLLLTNDGDLAHHLMHPRYGVEKLYRVVLADRPALKQIEKLQRGVTFEPGVRSAPARVRERDPVERGSVIEIAIAEGRYRQVRRMCEAVGLEVVALHRWGYGPLRLGDLARGMWRELSEEEVRLLRAGSARPKARPASVKRPRGRRRGEPVRAPGAERPVESDPFETARRGMADRDVTGWPGEAREEAGPREPRGRAPDHPRRGPRPAGAGAARARVAPSRELTRRFGRVPGGEERPRGGPPRRERGPAPGRGPREERRPGRDRVRSGETAGRERRSGRRQMGATARRDRRPDRMGSGELAARDRGPQRRRMGAPATRERRPDRIRSSAPAGRDRGPGRRQMGALAGRERRPDRVRAGEAQDRARRGAPAGRTFARRSGAGPGDRDAERRGRTPRRQGSAQRPEPRQGPAGRAPRGRGPARGPGRAGKPRRRG